MKTAMIWGATGGIGKAILSRLVHEGWQTVAVSRDTSSLDGLANFIFDARFEDPSLIEQVVRLAAQQVERINLWIYAAGDILFAKVGEMTPVDWQQIMDANLSSVFYAIHYSLPLLHENAHIVFLGAVSERLRIPGLSAYAAAKGGLEAFADALGKEYPQKQITVVRPGAVATSFWGKVPLRLPAKAALPEYIAQKIVEAYHTKHKGHLDLF